MRFYLVTRDGAPVAAFLTDAQRFGAMLHDIAPAYSVDHAVSFEGYALPTVDAEPWPADGSESGGITPASMARTAVHKLADHGHSWRFPDREERDLVRSNCGACALSGYGATRESGPGYAGWPRIYVQASRPIPIEWSRVLWCELAGGPVTDAEGFTSDPDPDYGERVRRDVATFGLRFVTPAGQTVDGAEVRR